MKKKISLIDKIRLFIIWMKEKNAIVVNCSCCGSINLKFKNGKLYKHTYQSEYECLNCGAKALNTEQWIDKNTYKEDSNV